MRKYGGNESWLYTNALVFKEFGLMQLFEREHKIAFARVITDLIEADFVVEADEMQFFEKIISKDGLSISDAMLVEAKKMDFAKALRILKTLNEGSRTKVVDILKRLSMSDSVKFASNPNRAGRKQCAYFLSDLESKPYLFDCNKTDIDSLSKNRFIFLLVKKVTLDELILFKNCNN